MPPDGRLNSDSDLESVISLQDLGPNSVRRRNSAGPKYNCSKDGCTASFKRLDHLDRHEYRHTGIKKHACTYEGCDKVYSIVTHLKRHLRTTHERTAPPQKNVPCSVDSCTKMFSSTCNMQRHIREVHENPKVYGCSHCGEKFTQKLKMRRHEITKHTGVYPYSCTQCSKGFYQQWQYERHLPVCRVYLYPCHDCDQQFSKWTLYLKHCREMQHGRRYYKCEHCGQVYAKPSELQRHVTAKHLLEKPPNETAFKCTHAGCGRSYAYERNLRQHMQTAHSGRRFQCEHESCGRVFSSAQNLAKHNERDHKQVVVGTVESDVATLPKKSKKSRKRRHDAGKPLVSHLTKLSGLTVADKEFDGLLREREAGALSFAVATLTQEMEEEDVSEEQEETNLVLDKSECRLQKGAAKTQDLELNSLIAIALQD